jgi:hypothetical protein
MAYPPALWRAAEEIGHPRFSLSSTAVLPDRDHCWALGPHDFGDHPDRFREAELVAAALGASSVYHFYQGTTKRLPMNNGRRLFSRKWDVPASFFYRNLLRMGEPYQGPLGELEEAPGHAWARVRAWCQEVTD